MFMGHLKPYNLNRDMYMYMGSSMVTRVTIFKDLGPLLMP